MIKKSLAFGLTAMLLAIPGHASAQALQTYSEEYQGAKRTIDQVLARLPEKITCINVTKERPINRGDLSTVSASSQVYVFTLTNTNLKLAGYYQLSMTSPSLVIYSMNSGGSAINLIVRVDNVTLEGTVLAISGNLPQPNTCQVGMKVTR